MVSGAGLSLRFLEPKQQMQCELPLSAPGVYGMVFFSWTLRELTGDCSSEDDLAVGVGGGVRTTSNRREEGRFLRSLSPESS